MACKGENCSCGNGKHRTHPQPASVIGVSDTPAGTAIRFSGKGLRVREVIAEVRFKSNRKTFFRVPSGMELKKDDLVIVREKEGFDLGCVTLTGERAAERYRRMIGEEPGPHLDTVQRLADSQDTALWLGLRREERFILSRSRKLAKIADPRMEIRDVEFRGDGKKIRIYLQHGNITRALPLKYMIQKEFGISTEIIPPPGPTLKFPREARVVIHPLSG